MEIHVSARIAEGAEIPEDVDIGPYCIVGRGVHLAPGCRLAAHVVIEGDTRLGEGCQVFPFAAIGTRPQDKKFKGANAKLRIGRGNTFREHVTIHGGTPNGTGITSIGNDNMFLVGSHVGHDAKVGNNVVFTNGAMVAGHTEIKDGAILGAMVGVHQFARVGELAMVGAGAMLTHDSPPYAMVQGDRARLVGVNVVGLSRAGLSVESAAAIKKAFRLLFWRTGTLTERCNAVRATDLVNDPHVKRVLAFLADTRRGICMPRGRRLILGDSKEAEF